MASNSDYYKLKTKAVDDLVNANESNSPKVSPEEIAKYSGRKRSRIAVKTWLKVCLIKFWFPAAICFFFVWGLGGYLQSLLDMLFVVGIALGLMTDILVNNCIRFITATDKEAKKWMVFSKKSYVSFLCNVVYGFVQIFLIYTLYNMVNVIAMQITGNQDQVFLSVEPIVFGLFALGIDLMFLGMKKLFGRILEDAKAAARK